MTEKLCPFRKTIYVMCGNQDGNFNTYLTKGEYFEEEFQPCLGNKCAMFDRYYEQCSLKNRFN